MSGPNGIKAEGLPFPTSPQMGAPAFAQGVLPFWALKSFLVWEALGSSSQIK